MSFVSTMQECPYSDLVDVASDRFDFVIKFETLQSDFSAVLDLLGVEQVGPIPVVNKTKGIVGLADSHYTPELVERARRVFGPFICKWDYEFPANWGGNRVSWIRTLEYRLLSFARTFYLTRYRYSQSPFSRVVRRLRSLL
jgi:hypothetical protein